MCLDDRRVELVSLVVVTAYEIVVIVVVRVVRDWARVVTRASTASWPVAVVSCCRGRRCSCRGERRVMSHAAVVDADFVQERQNAKTSAFKEADDFTVVWVFDWSPLDGLAQVLFLFRAQRPVGHHLLKLFIGEVDHQLFEASRSLRVMFVSI